jgi:hypothetical protein
VTRHPSRLLLLISVSAASASVALTTTGAAEAKTKWLCKPGLAHNPCQAGRTATVVSGGGGTAVEQPTPANKPPIDCFYIYPTVSTQPTVNADLNIDPEERAIATRQAARFSQDCRVFAPVYRQVTSAFITTPQPTASQVAYDSVLGAWRTYLHRYNHGRGVVLIGHSQGSAMLVKLIQQEIDGHPRVRHRLVSAILPGANVKVRKGSDVGGNFKHVPACHSSKQTGCVVAYESFSQTPPIVTFLGSVASPTNVIWPWTAGNLSKEKVLCVNPAALTGGTGALTPYFQTARFPGSYGRIWDSYDKRPSGSTPWVKYPKLYTARCESANGVHWLQVDDVGGLDDPRSRVEISPDLGAPWGLHVFDINLALGNLVVLVKREARAYVRNTR